VVALARRREAVTVITENDVVEATCVELKAHGWEVLTRANTQQRGPDIVARRDGQRLVIEAKGGTSARASSNRFGMRFNAGQVHSHVGRALVEALTAISAGDIAAVALPDERLHRLLIGRMATALDRAGVHVIWVDEDATTVSGVGDISTRAVSE
jgi:hypothetical protein